MAIPMLNRKQEPLPLQPPTLRPLSQIVREGRMEITPELAQRILKEANYERQRRLKPFRLHRHIRTIQRGQWDADNGSLRFALLSFASPLLVLIDGQHRLTAIAQTGKAQQVVVVISPAAKWEQVHTMYRRIDVDGNRSTRDALDADDPTAGRQIGKEMRAAAYKAMKPLANDFPHRKLGVGEDELVTKDDVITCMSYWLDELEVYDAIVMASQSSLRRRMREPGVIAVALATLKHQPESAKTFWSAVGNNTLLRPGDPEQALVHFLLTASLRDAHHIAERAAAQAWNAWCRRGRLQAIKKQLGNETPIKIDGTPFQGRT